MLQLYQFIITVVIVTTTISILTVLWFSSLFRTVVCIGFYSCTYFSIYVDIRCNFTDFLVYVIWASIAVAFLSVIFVNCVEMVQGMSNEHTVFIISYSGHWAFSIQNSWSWVERFIANNNRHHHQNAYSAVTMVSTPFTIISCCPGLRRVLENTGQPAVSWSCWLYPVGVWCSASEHFSRRLEGIVRWCRRLTCSKRANLLSEWPPVCLADLSCR